MLEIPANAPVEIQLAFVKAEYTSLERVFNLLSDKHELLKKDRDNLKIELQSMKEMVRKLL